MISQADYFGPRAQHPEVTPELRQAAMILLDNVNPLLDEAAASGTYKRLEDPDTGTEVSGSKGGSGDGGWRPSDAKTGRPKSSHKRACAVDVYDPGNLLDDWLTDDILEAHELYREHPEATPGWCHLQNVPPGSGNRTYRP